MLAFESALQSALPLTTRTIVTLEQRLTAFTAFDLVNAIFQRLVGPGHRRDRIAAEHVDASGGQRANLQIAAPTVLAASGDTLIEILDRSHEVILRPA